MVQTNDFGNELDILCVSSCKCAYVWILDSSTWQFAPGNRMVLYIQIDNFEFVYLRNDKRCTSTRTSQIKIVIDDGDVQILNKLTYISELRKT